MSRGAFQFYDEEQARSVGCPGPGMSFVLEEADAEDNQRLIADLIERFPDCGWVRIETNVLRSVGDGQLGAQRRDVDDVPNHVVAFCRNGAKKPSKSAQRDLATAASDAWVVPPPMPA